LASLPVQKIVLITSGEFYTVQIGDTRDGHPWCIITMAVRQWLWVRDQGVIYVSNARINVFGDIKEGDQSFTIAQEILQRW
jgi:hypothetical protein